MSRRGPTGSPVSRWSVRGGVTRPRRQRPDVDCCLPLSPLAMFRPILNRQKSHFSITIHLYVRIMVLEGLLMSRMSVARALDRMPEAFVSDKHITRTVSREVQGWKAAQAGLAALYPQHDRSSRCDRRPQFVEHSRRVLPGGACCRSDRTGERAGDRRLRLSDHRTRPGHRTAGSHPAAQARSGTASDRPAVSRRTVLEFYCARLSGKYASVAGASWARGSHPRPG